MSDRLHTTLFGRSLDDYRCEPIAPCCRTEQDYPTPDRA